MEALGLAAHTFFLEIQRTITDQLAALDGGAFQIDEWDRPEGGGGRSMIIQEGRLIEKGGVNVSCVHGELSDGFAKEIPGDGTRFFATGVSLVLHPRNPHVPTVHANFRYLEKGDAAAWFGGGSDLTPSILYDEDAIHFHRVWKSVCDRHPIADHARLKKWCDEYFFIAHREECRGVGGIFFDYFGLDAPKIGTPGDSEAVFAFVKDAASQFLESYLPIVERRRATLYTEAERTWQLTRRGRYVEFNLVYDRGTVFGLKTKGRTESILMSLPNLVRWGYDEHPEPGSKEARLIEVLRQPRDWLADG